MTFKLMNDEQYAKHWQNESQLFFKQKIYENLAQITPKLDTLEFGCGSGFSTYELQKTRRLLVIENNHYCINNTKKFFKEQKNSIPEIIEADLFKLSEDCLNQIKAFNPKVITGWFIGSNRGMLEIEPKKYRENVEDSLLSLAKEIGIEWVHLANRSIMKTSSSTDRVIQAVRDNYMQYVFEPNGFEIFDIKLFNWNREGSNFLYIFQQPNQDADENQDMDEITIITSILAKRKQE